MNVLPDDAPWLNFAGLDHEQLSVNQKVFGNGATAGTTACGLFEVVLQQLFPVGDTLESYEVFYRRKPALRERFSYLFIVLLKLLLILLNLFLTWSLLELFKPHLYGGLTYLLGEGYRLIVVLHFSNFLEVSEGLHCQLYLVSLQFAIADFNCEVAR